MNKDELYRNIHDQLAGRIQFLEDKPEEDLDSTIRALWLAAAGIPVSCVRAQEIELPPLNGSEEELLQKSIEQRIDGIPLAHLTKRQCFMGIELLADHRALIPRRETELLGNKALHLSRDITEKQGHALVIDVCCGSGNLAVAVAVLNPLATVYATDLSEEAVALARENVKFLDLDDRVQVEQGDFLSAFEDDAFYGNVDLIICNPPYISSGKVPRMPAEISSNEPALAFDGGMLGLGIIQKLIMDSPRFLKAAGWVVFEVGLGQGPFVVELLDRSGAYAQIETVCDPAGNIRAIAAENAT